jgi:hypothetical protein
MCAPKIQRGLMAIILTIGLYLMKFQPELMFMNAMIGELLILFIIGMIAIWAVFDFCPSLWFLGKFMKKDCN